MKISLSAVALCLLGCVEECPDLPAASLEGAPLLLSETGLYAQGSSNEPGSNVRPYRPRFEFWSDGASKQRWVRLPPGARIDATDMDFWRFPVGTRFWKEFSVEGLRVETRMMEKRSEADADWLFIAYAWNAEQTDASRVPDGATLALSTRHTIPAAKQCVACHGGTPARVLGFSAIQLADAPEGISTARLVEEGLLLSDPLPSLAIPGDVPTQEALGYLHVNCGHCHNTKRPKRQTPQLCFDPRTNFDLMLRVDSLSSVEATNPVRTVGEPSNPDWQWVLELMKRPSRQGGMPILGKEVVDDVGVAKVKAFVDSHRLK